jgi:hypothetical protein
MSQHPTPETSAITGLKQSHALSATILGMPKGKPIWKKDSERGDYDAALAFLSLIYPPTKVKALVRSLRAAPLIERSARDLLRACDLPLLAADERSVKEDLKKIAKGKPLEAVLLITGDMSKGIPLVVADGYHRICAIYHYDEDAPVMCRMANS